MTIPPLGADSPARVEFPAGTFGTSFRDSVVSGGVRRYVLQGGAGQRMALHVDAADDNATITITAPDGNVLTSGEIHRSSTCRRQATRWSRWSPSADPRSTRSASGSADRRSGRPAARFPGCEPPSSRNRRRTAQFADVSGHGADDQGVAWPPPPQRAAAPVPPPRRRSSCRIVRARRLPLMPIG